MQWIINRIHWNALELDVIRHNIPPALAKTFGRLSADFRPTFGLAGGWDLTEHDFANLIRREPGANLMARMRTWSEPDGPEARTWSEPGTGLRLEPWVWAA